MLLQPLDPPLDFLETTSDDDGDGDGDEDEWVTFSQIHSLRLVGIQILSEDLKIIKAASKIVASSKQGGFCKISVFRSNKFNISRYQESPLGIVPGLQP